MVDLLEIRPLIKMFNICVSKGFRRILLSTIDLLWEPLSANVQGRYEHYVIDQTWFIGVYLQRKVGSWVLYMMAPNAIILMYACKGQRNVDRQGKQLPHTASLTLGM